MFSWVNIYHFFEKIAIPPSTGYCFPLVFFLSLYYSIDVTLIFNTTAFKHGFTEKDIEYAMSAPLVDRLMEKHVNKYLILGFDTKGNLLEIMYNLVDEDTANVFHAMTCRKEMYKYLPRSR